MTMKLPLFAPTPLNRQAGFTLIEILVAMVVLSLGLLGLAGLQASSLRNNQIAYYRGLAAQQANDMADRMRANLAGVSAGQYDDLNDDTLDPGEMPTDPGCFTSESGCSAAQMAQTDYAQWYRNNAALLPNGTGEVACEVGESAGCASSGANWTFTVTITWSERGDAGTAVQSYVTRVSP